MLSPLPPAAGPDARAVPRRSDLSPARRRLARLIESCHFGRVCDLLVRGGEPLFDPPPRVVRTLRIGGGSNRPRQAVPDGDLARSLQELFDHLDRLADGVVERIEVAHGRPLYLEVRGTGAAEARRA
jgi:hypothetical protein